jgi:hypothetical protein
MTSKQKKALWTAVGGLLLGAVGTVGKTMLDRFVAPFDLEVDAQYIDAAGENHPAAGAVLDLPVVSVQTTDEGGRAYWKDVVPHWTEKKQIVVDPPFEVVSAPPVFLRRYSNPLSVLLRKAETQQAAATSGPAPAPGPAAAPAAAPAPPPPAPGPAAPGGRGRFAAAMIVHSPIGQAAEHVQLNATLVKPLAAAIAEAAAAPALPDETEIYRSGPQISGEGKNFSEGYALCSGDPPKGYVIKSNRFYLAGDRQCGRWATCKETRNEATKVCWEFSLQGHEEQTGFFRPGEKGQAYSEGVLSVVWTRATK